MKIFKLIILLLACNYIVFSTFGQANPSITVLPANAGLVSLGGTIDLEITVGNTGVASIGAFKLRPIIFLPGIVNFLPDAQQTGLPAGWSIVSGSNTGTQIRICNGNDVILGSTSRTIFLKIKGVAIGGPSTFSGQLTFGGASCAVAGPPPSGNNTADDVSTSTVEVFAGCSLGITATAGPIMCNGGTTTIAAIATNATGAVEYSISGTSSFQASNTFAVSAAGSPYTITAREVANPLTCVATAIITIAEPSPLLAPSINIMQPTCTVANGIVSINSATTGLTFSVDAGAYISYPSGGFALSAGTHTLIAKNSNNCTSPTVTVIINNQPATPTAPFIGIITQPNCTTSTGAVVLSALPLGNWTINPGNYTGNTTNTSLSNLPAGVYNYTVTNNVGCSSIASANVTINAVLGAPSAPVVTVVQPTCNVATGSIIITSLTSGLTFSLDNGTYVPYPSGGFANINSGNHTIIVKNVSGCLSPFTSFVVNPQPVSPPVAMVNILQPTCTISTATIIVTSDTTGLKYSLDNSLPFTSYPPGGYTMVPTGTHNLRVQNNSGCNPSITNNIIVTVQPASPSASATASGITCFGGYSILSVIGSGGILPYEFKLNNTTTFQPTNIFNVFAGTYFVTIKDANGCTSTTNSLTIGQPTAITATITTGAIACNGSSTILTVQAIGGAGAFEYSINNGAFQLSNTFNVVAGTYAASVRSITNPSCLVNTASVTLLQPNILKASASALPINYCGASTLVKVEAIGGKLPYTGIGNFNKGPGKWNYTVTDANGCVATSEVLILPPGCVSLKVFPNPAQNYITVNHDEALAESAIQIFAMNGALVLTKLIPKNAFITTIDISVLASATYLLVYINGNERKEIKFIKNNVK